MAKDKDDSGIGKDQAKELLKTILLTRDTMKELYALNRSYAKSLGEAEDIAKKINFEVGRQGYAANLALKASQDLQKSESERIALAKIARNIQEQQSDVLEDMVRAKADLVLKQTMLQTGLTGEYAEQAKNLRLLRDKKVISDKHYEKQIEYLRSQQETTKHYQKQTELVEEVSRSLTGIREESERWKLETLKILKTAEAIGKDPRMFGFFMLQQMGKLVGKVHSQFEDLGKSGMTVGQRVDAMVKGFSLMSVLGLSDTKGVLDGMAQSMGSINALTRSEVNQLGVLAKGMGTTGQQVFAMVENFSKLPGQTMKTAAASAEYVKQISKANGILPGKIVSDIAKNTELIALGGYKSAKAFTDAAVQAQKMGVDLQTTAKVMNGLLNFETSINKQLEASVLLGREINFDRARQLALEGKSVEATKEVLKNIGGQAAFDKMNVLQKQALAQATGMTVEELNKAVDAQKEYNKYHGPAVSKWKEMVGYAMEYGGAGIKFLKENATALLAVIQLMGFKNIQQVAGWAWEKAKFAWDKIASLWRTADKTKEITEEKTVQTVKQEGAAVNRIVGASAAAAAGPMLAFGAAALMVGAGIGLAALGLAKLVAAFKGLTGPQALGAVGALVVVMGGFVAILYAMIPAIGALGAVGAAVAIPLLALGGAFFLMGAGIALASYGLSFLVKSLKDIPFKNLIALPLAFIGIGAGLYLMAAAGLAALPIIGALTALAVVAPALSKLGGVLGGGGKKEADPVVEELKNLRAEMIGMRSDIKKGMKGDVIMDGYRVGEVVRLAMNMGTK